MSAHPEIPSYVQEFYELFIPVDRHQAEMINDRYDAHRSENLTGKAALSLAIEDVHTKLTSLTREEIEADPTGNLDALRMPEAKASNYQERQNANRWAIFRGLYVESLVANFLEKHPDEAERRETGLLHSTQPEDQALVEGLNDLIFDQNSCEATLTEDQPVFIAAFSALHKHREELSKRGQHMKEPLAFEQQAVRRALLNVFDDILERPDTIELNGHFLYQALLENGEPAYMLTRANGHTYTMTIYGDKAGDTPDTVETFTEQSHGGPIRHVSSAQDLTFSTADTLMFITDLGQAPVPRFTREEER